MQKLTDKYIADIDKNAMKNARTFCLFDFSKLLPLSLQRGFVTWRGKNVFSANRNKKLRN